MRAAIDGVNRVREGEYILLIAIVVLQCDFSGDNAANEFTLVGEINRIRMQCCFASV